jgi:hypothetical protein
MFSRNIGMLFSAGAALSLLVACAVSTPAPASTPALIWQDISRVGIVCLVQSERGVDSDLQAQLCQRVKAIASHGAPAPVEIFPHGDPSVLAAGTVTLLVHASIQPSGDQRLMALNIRPFRVSAEQSSVLFGAAPRAVALPRSGASLEALDPMLADILSNTVPWLGRTTGARPINR